MFESGIQEILPSFDSGCSKIYRIFGQILNSNAGDFQILVKMACFVENLGLIS